MTITRFRTALAPALAVIVACTLTPAPLFAAGGVATFNGHVLQPDGNTPQAGVTVVLVSVADGIADGQSTDGRQPAEFKSAPTGKDGSFRIEGAPAGTYALLVDTSDGAFLATDSLVLTAGINPRQSLTLRHGAENGKQPGAGQSLGSVTWGQWLIAGVIIVAAVVVANEVTDDVEEPASPF